MVAIREYMPRVLNEQALAEQLSMVITGVFNPPTGSLTGQKQLLWESMFYSSGAVEEGKN